jgi:glycosyltransferase involved in cell wall biosynthesis
MLHPDSSTRSSDASVALRMTAERTASMTDPKVSVAAITPGLHVPSARYRVRQLIPTLAENGVKVRELVPAISSYPPSAHWARPIWGGLAVAARVPLVAATHAYGMTLLQRELISTMVTLESWTQRPRVLDVDDAIFLRRDGSSARRVARMCDSVVCGNAFLEEWFSRWNSNVTVLPTAVDTSRYMPRREDAAPVNEVIGWVGTSSNLKFLLEIEPALTEVLAVRNKAKLLVVCDAKAQFGSLPSERVEFQRWSPETELAALRTMSVGIMPLEDSPWARGKCSFKMLVYMACGLPVVASPVGMNAEVFALGSLGVPATKPREWIDALIGLLDDPVTRTTMGRAGREVAQKHFSVEVIAPRLAEHLMSVARAAGR